MPTETSTTELPYVAHIVAIRSEINLQKMQLEDKDQDQIRRLDQAMDHVNQAQAILKKYYDVNAKIFSGTVTFVDRSPEIWIGKLDDDNGGGLVMIRPGNIGPGEKLVRRANNTIMVESYGGVWRTPPFIKIG